MAKAGADADEWVQGHDPEVERLREENARLSKLLGLVESHRAAAGKPPAWARPARKAKAHRATAVMQLSDLHLDEVVNPRELDGLNAYNRVIAAQRLKRWADAVCHLGEHAPHEWDGAVVVWGGDMVSGSIHDELRETNVDVLPGTLVYWAPLLAAALKQVVDFYGALHVPAVVGNHGRLTDKKQCKRRGRNSWDFLLLQMVRGYFSGDKHVTWDVSDGPHLFVGLYSRHFHVTHGDHVGGGNGWVGVMSPLGTIHRRGVELGHMLGIRPAYSAIHHWHSLVLAHETGRVCNGTMKGPDEYSHFLGLPPQPASQSWWIETEAHGVGMRAPVRVVDRAKEGW